MQFLNSAMHKLKEYNDLIHALKKNRIPAALSGLSQIHKALIVSSLIKDTGQPAILIASDDGEASRISEDLQAMGKRVLNYPARDYTFRNIAGQSHEYEHVRIGTLSKMLEGDYDVVVAGIDAAAQLTIPSRELKNRTFTLKAGQNIAPADIVKYLVSAGYMRSDQVEGAGQFALRGGVLDFFASDMEMPVRFEFWGDEIDSISNFEVESQRRTDNLKQVNIIPASEVLFDSADSLIELIEQFKSAHKRIPDKALSQLDSDIDSLKSGINIATDKYISLAYGSGETLFDYVGNAILFISESAKVKEKYKNYLWQYGEDLKGLFEDGFICSGLDKFCIDNGEILNKFENLGALYLENFPRGNYDTAIKESISFTLKQSSQWSGSLEVLLEDLGSLKPNSLYIILAGAQRAATVLTDELRRKNVAATYIENIETLPDSGIVVTLGGLSAGFEIPSVGFTLITHGRVAARKSNFKKRADNTKEIRSLEDIKSGDYVVHSAHGIGVFEGIHQLTVEKITKDYIKIRYAKQDVLYVPVTQLDLVSKYIGPQEDANIKLHRLGGTEWQKTRKRVRAAVKDMAKQLTALYAKRMQTKGHAFSPDTDMQSDFENRFEYDETNDQLRCIREIKEDMERTVPMDRLLCGDVGFGKTEVALRAAFKCIVEGKQCALLVPTTILAWQHFQTAWKRIGDIPVRVELLSRFRSPKQQEEIIKQLRRGSLDMIIGTHRIISRDVQFKDLGLVIIDEEQRFGVAQKERLKELLPVVDVLTLSATPIPRTLNMAMSGLRDMSVIEEAPQDRHPVQTYVLEQENSILVDAISKELRRGGQVYYLHNRVDSIDACAARLSTQLPDCRIATAHGKMNENELSEVWQKLLEHEVDVLVCTTIIETGVDVPNANTLIIEDADRMGLSQLHQLRGRVGRSPRRAYAYLCFKKGKALSDIATKRLEAIRQYTEFGSGFKIAMRDLEIRGAGNILGGEQHGHMEAVGYDMYLKLLADAINEEKGLATTPDVECTVDLRISAHIPEKYITSLPQRLSIYRRIAEIRSDEDSADVLDELIDRFGEPPEAVKGLIDTALLRNRAAMLGIYEVTQKDNSMLLYISSIDTEKVSKLVGGLKGRVMLSAGNKPYFSVRMLKNQKPLETLREALDALSQ